MPEVFEKRGKGEKTKLSFEIAQKIREERR